MATVRLTETIRLTTTFACRVYRNGMGEPPPGRILRRGDVLAVAGRPERVGAFDKFMVADRSGYVLVPRSRWAWVRPGRPSNQRSS